ncbi:MAG: hypothetical protein E7638_00270 [Ruminococcaceae bacterium]|nr:hypothetical protein [Oscillospiraceae bacterium]
MENEITRKLALKRFDTTHTLDVTEDFSLPDYIPEVRRIVGVQASPSVDGKYLNGDELEADGTVSYTVLYLGGDGGLCSVPLTTAFDGRIPVKSTEGDVFGTDDLSLSSSAENVICRVTAPRRLTLSSKVKMRLFSQKTVDCAEKISAEDKKASVKLKKDKAEYAAVKALRSNIECGGELREREGTKVISAVGSLSINDAKVTKDGISVMGEARISLLLLTPDGVYTTAKGRCAVDTVIPCDTANAMGAAAYGRCLMCEIDTAEDGLITWNMECDIDCDCMMGGETEISTDGYCADYRDECTYTDAAALSALKGVNGRLTVSGTKAVRPGMTWAGGWGKAAFDKAEQNGRRLTLTGNAVITSILCGEGEATAEECVIPVKYECETDGKESGGELVGKCEFSVCDVGGRCDGETLNVTAELAINGVFLGERGLRYLETMTIDENAPTARRKNVLTICVPDEGESEWDVMKRYRVGDNGVNRTGKVYIIS